SAKTGPDPSKVLSEAKAAVRELQREAARNPTLIFGPSPSLNPNLGGGRRPAPRRGGGGGRARARSATRQAPKAVAPQTSGVTVAEALAALQGGRPEVLQERLQNIAAGTPRAEDIRPTVAMTVSITNNDVDVTQHITAPDAVDAGRQA